MKGFKEKETKDRVEEVTDGLVEVKESHDNC